MYGVNVELQASDLLFCKQKLHNKGWSAHLFWHLVYVMLCVCVSAQPIACVYKSSSLGAMALQVKDPRARFVVTLRALAGDGQIAKPRPRRSSCRELKGYHDVLGLFGGDCVHTFHSKAGIVHLGAR